MCAPPPVEIAERSEARRGHRVEGDDSGERAIPPSAAQPDPVECRTRAKDQLRPLRPDLPVRRLRPAGRIEVAMALPLR